MKEIIDCSTFIKYALEFLNVFFMTHFYFSKTFLDENINLKYRYENTKIRTAQVGLEFTYYKISEILRLYLKIKDGTHYTGPEPSFDSGSAL